MAQMKKICAEHTKKEKANMRKITGDFYFGVKKKIINICVVVIINLHCRPDWSSNHLGDTLLATFENIAMESYIRLENIP